MTKAYKILTAQDYGELADFLESELCDPKEPKPTICLHIWKHDLEDDKFVDGSSTEGLEWPWRDEVILYMARVGTTRQTKKGTHIWRRHTHREIVQEAFAF